MDDSAYMRRALELASRVEGMVSPRPPVGAVLVAADGSRSWAGWTTPSPGPHAEVVALDAAGPAAAGGTLYVTLEPCSHTSVTPPCAEAIVAAGVHRVVAATIDPDPRVHGEGFRRLVAAGIEVRRGVLRDRARRLIAPFTKWIRTGRPSVTLKMAVSLDGKVAAPDGTSRWITGATARAEVHDLRRRVDAVLVGSGTVEADDPALTWRSEGSQGAQPVRVVADSSGRTQVSAQVFDTRAPVVMLASEQTPAAAVEAWRGAGADVLLTGATEAGVDLAEGLTQLATRGVCHVLCEGGPGLAASLVAEDLVDRFLIYLAPKLIGGEAPGLLSSGVKSLEDAWGIAIERVGRAGEDVRIEGVRA